MHFPPEQEGAPWLELLVPLSGRLEGFVAHVRLELDGDGQVGVREVALRTRLLKRSIEVTDDGRVGTREVAGLLPLATTGRRALRDLGLGDLAAMAERAVVNLHKSQALPRDARPVVLRWIKAFAAERQRPGRARTADHLYAEVAQKRVDAEKRWPGRAIKGMVDEWPELFVSESAATAKVYKARQRGMLEPGRHPRLTPQARELLGLAEDES